MAELSQRAVITSDQPEGDIITWDERIGAELGDGLLESPNDIVWLAAVGQFNHRVEGARDPYNWTLIEAQSAAANSVLLKRARNSQYGPRSPAEDEHRCMIA